MNGRRIVWTIRQQSLEQILEVFLFELVQSIIGLDTSTRLKTGTAATPGRAMLHRLNWGWRKSLKYHRQIDPGGSVFRIGFASQSNALIGRWDKSLMASMGLRHHLWKKNVIVDDSETAENNLCIVFLLRAGSSNRPENFSMLFPRRSNP